MAINILDGVLRAVAMFHPELKNLIDIALKYESQLEMLAPVIEAADKEGTSAFDAAVKAAPDLAKAIHDFVTALPAQAPSAAEADRTIAVKKEAVSRHIFGARPMTNEEEDTWRARAENGGC